MSYTVLNWRSPGSKGEDGHAVVPSDKLAGLPLDEINGRILNNGEEVSEEVGKAIVNLYARLGLERDDEQETEMDLVEFIDAPRTDKTIDREITFGWAY